MSSIATLLLFSLVSGPASDAADVGNRLTYLDAACDPYYAGLQTPRLTTPQWVGEDGVEAVIVLSCDDLKEPARHEAYLRPVLQRLKQIDGRASMSLMATRIPADDPIVSRWLAEGVSIEVHTTDHPCPLCQHGDFGKAKATFDTCIDRLEGSINPGPVAFRMPCCDSMNSVSPRFFAEIFNKTTPGGNFLAVDSSVFLLFTPSDPALARPLVFDADGTEKFRKYIPTDRKMVNLVEDYPYPYVIGRKCWEIPALMPSDWDAQHHNGKASPTTVKDYQTAVDAVVAKQGIFAICFHPYDWQKNSQVVELIDYAVKRYGKKIKFLSFREVLRRINQNALAGASLRTAEGGDAGVRLLDVNNDGRMDVVRGGGPSPVTRVWNAKSRSWNETPLPVPLVADGTRRGVRFGVLQPSGMASMIVKDEAGQGLWHFDGKRWVADARVGGGKASPVALAAGGRDRGVRLRDLDGDGICELIVGNERENAVYAFSGDGGGWRKLPFKLPEGTRIVDAQGRDAGLRFADIDEDGHADVVFSDPRTYSAHVFNGMDAGWSRKMLSGRRGQGDARELPPIVRADGTNNGVWFKFRHMWTQNEDTGGSLEDQIDSRYFTDDFLSSEKEPPPRSPASALASFKPRPGFKVEQMACEPMVMDCIDMAWGPDGKLWVVEMTDYPMGLDGAGQPGGRVRFLEDTDGDGQYDKSTVFLEPVGFPSGVMPWRKGVIVTAAPNVFYAEDTDGDGRADVRKTLLTGFHEGNQQHRVNHPRWGLDNWVYLANGDSDGLIRSLVSNEVLDISGMDLRFRPDEGTLDAQTGRSQYGRNRDDWGNWFGCNNNNPGWNYVLADQYLRRNPHVPTPPGRLDLTQYRDAYPAGRVMTHCFIDQPTPPEGHPGRWTSVASAMIYRDELLGPRFTGNLFVSDSVYSVVHRLILSHDGLRIHGRRGPGEDLTEFLATTDPWFRPTTLRTGPDGALWVADMYRYVIEHPQWIDDRLEKTLDLRRGHDRGRLYRIYPVDKTPRPVPRLDRLDTAGLVAALDSPSGWQRDLAQQMLLWRADRGAIPLLEKMVTGCPRPVARLQALCALDGLHALRPEIALAALKDTCPGVRRHAIRTSEPLLAQHPQVGEALLKLGEDPDAFVQMQLAYSLGEWKDARAGKMLAQMAIRHADDPYLTAAVMSSAVAHVETMIAASKAAGAKPALIARLVKLQADVKAHPQGVSRVVTAERTRVAKPGQGVITQETSPRVQAALDKFAAVLEMKGDPVRGKQVFVDATCSICHRLEDVGEEIGPDIRTLVDRSPQNILVAVVDPNRAVKERYVEYVALTADGLTYNGMLLDQTSTSVTLANSKGEKIVLLRRDLEELVPTPKSFMSEGLEERVDPQQMADLLAFVHNAGAPRKRFPGNEPGMLLVSQDNSLELPPAKAEIYGPEIKFNRQKGTLDSWTSGEDYVVWTAGLGGARPFDVWARWACADADAGKPFLIEVGGKTITGKVPASGSWEEFRWDKVGQLRLPAGTQRIGFRSDGPLEGPFARLATIKLMPVGKKPFAVANRARDVDAKNVLHPEADGSIRLAATNAKAIGPHIKFMPEWDAFGWFFAQDRVQWQVEVPKLGRYEAWLEWAITDEHSGKPWDLRVGTSRLVGAVAKTGSWENYRKMKIGVIELKPGLQTAVFRAGGGFEGPLLDFREIRLVPLDKP